jgi:RNA polymerase sigma factor (sigma-70 family)
MDPTDRQTAGGVAMAADVVPEIESFDSFYARETPRLAALARSMCGQVAADDLAQEAMIVAYRSWSQVGGYDQPAAWVRRVCLNLAGSWLRRRAAESRALQRLGRLEDRYTDPDDEIVLSALRRLPRRQAQAMTLRCLYDLPLTEIASALDCSAGTVKVHLSRARTTLRSGML